MKIIFFTATFIFTFIFNITTAFAWIYPEHRKITLNAVEKLNTQYRAILDRLWVEARMGYEFRLSNSVIVQEQTTNPKLLDFAAWPAIAGDHSCSASNMFHNILETEWILKVADIAANLKIDLSSATDRIDRINALRNSDVHLQGADPEYATRAGSNNAHFLKALKNEIMTVEEYRNSCLKQNSEITAIGVYTWYHYNAMLKATRLATEKLSSSERSTLIISALMDEAFALHFLEDVFAAGHVAGTWGNTPQRKGTHDYYNERGLKTSTWEGKQVILTGDAWMREIDADRAAEIISLSLQQFLNAANGNTEYYLFTNNVVKNKPDSFDVCKTNYIPEHKFDSKILKLLDTILIKTPVPGLGRGLGELPRFRAEIGFFAGSSPALSGSVISSGFLQNQNSVGLIGALEANVRFGVGLDGVLGEAGDGLAFLEFGWKQTGVSSTGIIDEIPFNNFGNLLAAIPSRSAFEIRFRLPFYLIPGDLLLAGPFLYLFDKEALTNMGVKAVNGGLIPWQTGIETSIGRFQFCSWKRNCSFTFSVEQNQKML